MTATRADPNQWQCQACGRWYAFPHWPELATVEDGKFRAWCSWACLPVKDRAS